MLAAVSGERPFHSLADLRVRTGLAPSDLRALIKVGALDSIAGGWTRPMMLWLVDSTAEERPRDPTIARGDWFDRSAAGRARPPGVHAERRRREEFAALGFITDAHPMRLHADALARFRLCPSTELPPRRASTSWRGHAHHRQAGAYPEGRADGVRHLRRWHGLIETVLFPGGLPRARSRPVRSGAVHLSGEGRGGVRRGHAHHDAPGAAGADAGESGGPKAISPCWANRTFRFPTGVVNSPAPRSRTGAGRPNRAPRDAPGSRPRRSRYGTATLAVPLGTDKLPSRSSRPTGISSSSRRNSNRVAESGKSLGFLTASATTTGGPLRVRASDGHRDPP